MISITGVFANFERKFVYFVFRASHAVPCAVSKMAATCHLAHGTSVSISWGRPPDIRRR